MKQLIKNYLKILNEDKNYFGFQINDHTFIPFEYKNVFCCASSLNKDINHILTRLFARTNVNINDIFIMLKRGIDKFLQIKDNKYKNRRTKTFHVISKSYPDFKLVIQIVKNDQKDIFRYLENKNEFFFNCNYVCFLYTILISNMQKRETDDELFVESSANNKNINILTVQ